jgi:hypothetical protein
MDGCIMHARDPRKSDMLPCLMMMLLFEKGNGRGIGVKKQQLRPFFFSLAAATFCSALGLEVWDLGRAVLARLYRASCCFGSCPLGYGRHVGQCRYSIVNLFFGPGTARGTFSGRAGPSTALKIFLLVFFFHL